MAKIVNEREGTIKTCPKKSAIETMLEWKYNPTAIERKVENRAFTKSELKIINNVKF